MSAAVLSRSSGTESQISNESLAATSWLESWMLGADEPGIVVISGTMRNEGESRKASSVASATSFGVPIEAPWPIASKRATSASDSGRRNALRPKLLMVVVRQPAVAGSQLMNFAFWVGLAMTAFAIAVPTSL